MNRFITICYVFAWAIPFTIGETLADDWPRFRGPDLNGISQEKIRTDSGVLETVWKANVGLGHSSFVVADGRAFTTGHNGADTDTVFCFDAKDGELLWSHSYTHPLDDLYYSGGTTGTPTIDGKVVYHLARRGQLFCFDTASGVIQWSKNLSSDFGIDMPTWGFSGSPVVDGPRLLLNAGDAGLALNKKDGSIIWQSVNGEASYSTPGLLVRNNRELALFSNNRGYVCVDRSSGEEMWRIKWLTRFGVNATIPIVSEENVFLSTGYGKGGTLLRFGDHEATTGPEEVWKSRDFSTKMNTALLIDGFLYGIHGDEGQDGTGLKCLHLESGETRWIEKSFGHGSVIAAEGQLIAMSEQGELQIAPISSHGFSPTLSQSVLDSKCWTVPTLANGLLYCRNDSGNVVVLDLRP